MSKAYICDKCGKIQQGEMQAVWTVNPYISSEYYAKMVHLCSECYDEFEREYLANLRENGGA